jgi:hypothetical protein
MKWTTVCYEIRGFARPVEPASRPGYMNLSKVHLEHASSVREAREVKQSMESRGVRDVGIFRIQRLEN